MEWSLDIAAAPRGRKLSTSKIGKDGKKVTNTHIERERVWLASKCGKVILSYWIWPPEKPRPAQFPYGRWSMLGGYGPEKPLAWRRFIQGEFPRIVTKIKGKPDLVEYPNGRAPEYPRMLLGVAA